LSVPGADGGAGREISHPALLFSGQRTFDFSLRGIVSERVRALNPIGSRRDRISKAHWIWMMDAQRSVAPPERQAEMRLSDGRRLAWSEWGPADGHPVLFCTGAGMSGSLAFGAGALHPLGLRLISMDRPGLGRSDPHPDKTLASWVGDVRELIRAQGLHDPLCVAFSQGAPFGFALAGAGLVRALAVVAGQDQLDHPRLRPLLHPDVAGLLAAVQADPAGFQRHVAGMATAEWLWTLIVETSDARDAELYRADFFGPAYRRALEEGFSRGADGYARDLVNALAPWTVQPEDVEIPVDLWYGARDTSRTHSPDHGATLASRLRNGSHVVDPEAGGSILWTRSHEILAKLSSHLSATPDEQG
jgi:pimeloyl-ACP methyl ester carboxylesterase